MKYISIVKPPQELKFGKGYLIKGGICSYYPSTENTVLLLSWKKIKNQPNTIADYKNVLTHACNTNQVSTNSHDFNQSRVSDQTKPSSTLEPVVKPAVRVKTGSDTVHMYKPVLTLYTCTEYL